MDSIEKFISKNYINYISEWYFYLNRHDKISLSGSNVYMNNLSIESVDENIKALISTGVKIKNDKGNQYKLCKIAYMISQLITMKGIMIGFNKRERYNIDSKELFKLALKYAERAYYPEYKNPFVPFQMSFLHNELGYKRNAIIALENIQERNEKYNKKIMWINEIMYDLCDIEKHEYRKLLYDTQAKLIPGLCNKDNGFFQKISSIYYNNKQYIKNISDVKSEIDQYAFAYGYSQENAHDVICRNLYLTRHDNNGKTKKTRLLFWLLYCEKTITLYLENNK